MTHILSWFYPVAGRYFIVFNNDEVLSVMKTMNNK